MRIRVARGAPSMGTGWSSHRRKAVLDIDINIPPCANANEVGTSSYVHVEAEAAGQLAPPQPVSIDVYSIDDDVVLVSPRAFVEATKKPRRNRRRNNAVELGIQARRCNKRGREPTNQHIINCESYIDLECIGYTLNGNDKNLSKQPKGTNMPLPQDPTFSCPICLGTLVEEMSTKCGHIFCKTCIKQAIAAQGKCPTCRNKVTMKNIFRIYLPATNFSHRYAFRV